MSSEQMNLSRELENAALECADMGGFGVLPSPYRRAFVDALQSDLDAGADLIGLTASLAKLRPEEMLSLAEPLRGFLTSPEGLGISDSDLPIDAMDYLSLLVFLRGEMDEGHLPYRDFCEMAHAAGEGRTLAEGLARSDRERLVRQRIEPVLRRLWPRNDARVAAEVARLLEE
jgi:hypothetical protein